MRIIGQFINDLIFVICHKGNDKKREEYFQFKIKCNFIILIFLSSLVHL